MLCAQVAERATHRHDAERTPPSPAFAWSGIVLVSVNQQSRRLTSHPTAYRLGPGFRALARNYGDALREAFVAYREYQHLTSNHMPPDAPLRKVFGLDQARVIGLRTGGHRGPPRPYR